MIPEYFKRVKVHREPAMSSMNPTYQGVTHA